VENWTGFLVPTRSVATRKERTIGSYHAEGVVRGRFGFFFRQKPLTQLPCSDEIIAVKKRLVASG
jgi:hypothetical protein